MAEDLKSTNFYKLISLPSFVDKTLLIKRIFNGGKKYLITAPTKFFKTTNLEMIKCFLSTNEDKKDNLEFEKLKIYEKNNRQFYKENLHMHPVLYVNFTGGYSSSYDSVLDSYRHAIHKAYMEHVDTLVQSRLTENMFDLFQSWTNVLSDGYSVMTENKVANGLASLVSMLKHVHKKDVVVLIDGYDSVVNKATFYNPLPEHVFVRIRALTWMILSKLLKDNKDVSTCVLTGVSYVTMHSLYEDCSLELCPFLGNHRFVEFFGLTNTDLDTLLEKKEFRYTSEKEIVQKMYGGYISLNRTYIYNPYSTLKYLVSKYQKIYWKNTQYIQNLVDVSEIPNIFLTLDNILRGGCEEISTQILNEKDLSFYLKDLYKKPPTEPKTNYTNLILLHTFEQGLFTYDLERSSSDVYHPCHKPKRMAIKIPNKEIYLELNGIFQNYLISRCAASMHLLTEDYKDFRSRMDAFGSSEWNALVR